MFDPPTFLEGANLFLPRESNPDNSEITKVGKQLSMTYNINATHSQVLTPSNYEIEAIRTGHPKFSRRPERLDLISHNMLGITVAVNDKRYVACDISETGFSFAQQIPIKKRISFKQAQVAVEKIARKNYEQLKQFSFSFDGAQEKGIIRAKGKVKNHRLFLGFTIDDMEKEVKAHLYRKNIRPKNDPHNYYGKLQLMIKNARRKLLISEAPKKFNIALNTTYINILEEIGASPEEIEAVYLGYINKPLFIKYGVSVSDPKEAANLFTFAEKKDAAFLNQAHELKQKSPKYSYFRQLNKKYSPNAFIIRVWRECLRAFQIESSLSLPKIKSRKLAIRLKLELDEFKGQIEHLGDPDFKKGSCLAISSFLAGGLYLDMVEKDKKYFDRKRVEEDVKKMIEITFSKCLKELGYKEPKNRILMPSSSNPLL